MTPSIFAPVSTPAFAIRDLSFVVLAITGAIFVIVGGFAVYTLIRFGRRQRRRGGDPRAPALDVTQPHDEARVQVARPGTRDELTCAWREVAGGVKLDRTPPASCGWPLFEVEHLSLVYPPVSGQPAATILSEVLVTVECGEALALVGPSGSGKSSLLRCLNRLVEPSAGTVRFEGRDIRTLDPRELRRQAALVMQTPVVFEGTVGDNLRIRARDARGDFSEAVVRDALAEVGLDPAVLPREAATPSGGEKLVPVDRQARASDRVRGCFCSFLRICPCERGRLSAHHHHKGVPQMWEPARRPRTIRDRTLNSERIANHGRESNPTRAPDADRESYRNRDHQQSAGQFAQHRRVRQAARVLRRV